MSSYRGGNCSAHPWSPLNVNSATLSNVAHDGHAERPALQPTTQPATQPTNTHVSVRIAIVLLRLYKLLLSPLFTGSCRYVPSCSDYTADAIRADRKSVV